MEVSLLGLRSGSRRVWELGRRRHSPLLGEVFPYLSGSHVFKWRISSMSNEKEHSVLKPHVHHPDLSVTAIHQFSFYLSPHPLFLL